MKTVIAMVIVVVAVCAPAPRAVAGSDDFLASMKAMKASFKCLQGGLLKFRCTDDEHEVADFRNSFEGAKKLIAVEFNDIPDKAHIIPGVQAEFNELDKVLTELSAAVALKTKDAAAAALAKAAALVKVQKIMDHSHETYKDPYEQ